jgi:hypothetical protein
MKSIRPSTAMTRSAWRLTAHRTLLKKSHVNGTATRFPHGVSELITTLRKIEGRGANEVAHRLKAVCSQVFSYGIQSGLLERNIAVDMKAPMKNVGTLVAMKVFTQSHPDFELPMKQFCAVFQEGIESVAHGTLISAAKSASVRT